MLRHTAFTNHGCSPSKSPKCFVNHLLTGMIPQIGDSNTSSESEGIRRILEDHVVFLLLDEDYLTQNLTWEKTG